MSFHCWTGWTPHAHLGFVRVPSWDRDRVPPPVARRSYSRSSPDPVRTLPEYEQPVAGLRLLQRTREQVPRFFGRNVPQQVEGPLPIALIIRRTWRRRITPCAGVSPTRGEFLEESAQAAGQLTQCSELIQTLYRGPVPFLDSFIKEPGGRRYISVLGRSASLSTVVVFALSIGSTA